MKIIKQHIEDCMRSFFSSLEDREVVYARLDELFLLWSKLKGINFVQSVEEFGLDYKHFNDRRYDKIFVAIGKKFPELMEVPY